MPRASMELGEHVLMAFRMPCVTQSPHGARMSLGVRLLRNMCTIFGSSRRSRSPALGHPVPRRRDS